jgi:hypothetical protein
MLWVWQLLRLTWLPASTSQMPRSLTTTREQQQLLFKCSTVLLQPCDVAVLLGDSSIAGNVSRHGYMQRGLQHVEQHKQQLQQAFVQPDGAACAS